MGRADSEFRLTKEHWGWDVRQPRATAGPRPRPTMPAPRLAKALAPAPQTGSPAPLRLRQGLPLVVEAADSAPVGSPSGWARGPDPRCGKRESMRPQPKRAPRCEVMARGPSRWGGLRPGGGRGAHTGMGRLRDGMGPSRRGAAAVPCAGRSRGRVREHPPPHHPPTTTRTDGGHGLSRQGAPADRGLAGMGNTTARSAPPPPLRPWPRPSCDLPWPPCGLPPAFFAYDMGTARTRMRTRPGTRARARGAGLPAPLAPATPPWPLPAAMVVHLGYLGVPRPPPAPGVG